MFDDVHSFPWELINFWIEEDEAELLIDNLLKNLSWSKPRVFVYGKHHFVPRYVCFLGEKGITYKYSGIKHHAIKWPDWFLPILVKVRNECKTNFNGCLLNLYRNGSDKMGWHSDNEKELNSLKSIASLSLGASRDLVFKNISNDEKVTIELKNRDLLIMHPGCQKSWLHSLPPRIKSKGIRVNLTFREYVLYS